MDDNYYQKKLGLLDKNGNLTNQAKINRVRGVVGRFGYSDRDCENALIINDWDMEAAVNYIRLSDDRVYEYVNRHQDRVHQQLYMDPSSVESTAKFVSDHSQLINATKATTQAASSVISALCGVIGVVAILIIVALFGL